MFTRLKHKIQYHTVRLIRIIFRIKTRAARVIVRRANSVLLVKFVYDKVWTLPGGYVNKGESFQQAARRELFEETAIRVEKFDRMLGEYHDTRGGRNKYIRIFVVEDWVSKIKLPESTEIKAIRWVPLNNLPHNVSGPTKRRISEYLSRSKKEFSGKW